MWILLAKVLNDNFTCGEGEKPQAALTVKPKLRSFLNRNMTFRLFQFFTHIFLMLHSTLLQWSNFSDKKRKQKIKKKKKQYSGVKKLLHSSQFFFFLSFLGINSSCKSNRTFFKGGSRYPSIWQPNQEHMSFNVSHFFSTTIYYTNICDFFN